MLSRVLPPPVIGVLTALAMLLALLGVAAPLLLPVAILKILLPFPALRRQLDRWLNWAAATAWVGSHHLIFYLLHGPRTKLEIDEGLDPDQSWILIANHQSWADILILVDVLYRRIAFPRFFIKRQLIWIPIIGFLAWALDMPFMRRSSPEALAKHPELRDADVETTRRFCRIFVGRATTIVNFVEGTRGTAAKRLAKQSPYRHLLRPKSAGLSFTLNAMGEQFAGLIDMTIAYAPRPAGRSVLWSFLCGAQTAATVIVRKRPLPAELLSGDYQNDAAFRQRFQTWLNALWQEKDQLIETAQPR